MYHVNRWQASNGGGGNNEAGEWEMASVYDGGGGDGTRTMLRNPKELATTGLVVGVGGLKRRRFGLGGRCRRRLGLRRR